MGETYLLVPLDGSKTAENVLPAARTMAAAYGLPVRFLEVVESSEGPTGRSDPERCRTLFDSYARELAERHGLKSDQISTATVSGHPAEAILDDARGATMLALATHGRGGFRATLLGSVADKVVRGAHVPVLAVPAVGEAKDLGDGPLVVTFDGSAGAERALPVARDAARRLGKELVLLQSFSLVPPPPAEMAYYPPDYVAQMEESARASLAKAALPGERMQLVSGPTVEAIIEGVEALDAALIVMAASGKGLAKRLSLGSTTDGVLHHVHRPMLIVPPPAEH